MQCSLYISLETQMCTQTQEQNMEPVCLCYMNLLTTQKLLSSDLYFIERTTYVQNQIACLLNIGKVYPAETKTVTDVYL